MNPDANGETVHLHRLISDAVYDFTDYPDLVATTVLDALGLERVPTLAISRTDEHIEGVPFGIHRKPGDPFCGDESICAEHEPVYRLRGPIGSRDGGSDG